MKLSIRTVIPFAVCILAVSLGHASTRQARSFQPTMGRDLVSPHAVLDAGDVDDVPPTWTLEPTIVTGTVPSLSSSSGALSASRTVRATPAMPPRHWVCGPVEANAIGGAQRSCEYL